MSLLTPQDRTLLIESLRPPDGYELDVALGTTYSLDLLAMMVAPVGFTFFNLESGESGQSDTTPLELLEAIRRHAGQMVLFCEAGRIAVPPKHRVLFSFLEERIIQSRAPVKGKAFHPKVWVLRFQPIDREAGVLYRLLCLSRNLTFDQSWDSILILDGHLREDREKGFAVNRPLQEFVAALTSMASSPVSREIQTQVARVEGEIARVEWSLAGTPFESYAFWPLGLEGKATWPFKSRMDRILVVSPFLTAKTLERLTDGDVRAELVSRTESLDELPEATRERFETVYVLSRGDAAGEPVDAEDTSPVLIAADEKLRGLHAKLFLADDGWNAHVWTGSANATSAAFAGNVEFMVQLTGKKSQVGVGTFMERVNGEASFVSMLGEYEPPDASEVDVELEKLKHEIDELRGDIASAGWRIRTEAAGSGDTYGLTILTDDNLPIWADSVEVKCRPLSVPDDKAIPIASGRRVNAPLDAVSLEALTAFLVVTVTATRNGKTAKAGFVVLGRIEGAPANRRDRLLQSMIRDRASLVRFLLLLLADMDQAPISLDGNGDQSSTGRPGSQSNSDALLEPLMRALERRPERLRTIEGLLDELRASPDSQHLVPPGLHALFDALKGARPEVFK